MAKFKNFWNDDDGLSAKDFLMVSFGISFLLMIITAFIIALVGTLPPLVISVIQLMDGVVITIVGGVFGIQGIKEFRNNTTQETIQYLDDTYTNNEEENNTLP